MSKLNWFMHMFYSLEIVALSDNQLLQSSFQTSGPHKLTILEHIGSSCPVVVSCLGSSLSRDSFHKIWFSITFTQRSQLFTKGASTNSCWSHSHCEQCTSNIIRVTANPLSVTNMAYLLLGWYYLDHTESYRISLSNFLTVAVVSPRVQESCPRVKNKNITKTEGQTQWIWKLFFSLKIYIFCFWVDTDIVGVAGAVKKRSHSHNTDQILLMRISLKMCILHCLFQLCLGSFPKTTVGDFKRTQGN